MSKFIYPAACGLTLMTFISTAAQAQMMQQPWSFTPQNRASIAALMQQTERPAALAAPASSDTLICGGGTGESSATANSTCIILNNATGQIELGQDSTGDQSASSLNENAEAMPEGESDAVLATLDGTLQTPAQQGESHVQ